MSDHRTFGLKFVDDDVKYIIIAMKGSSKEQIIEKLKSKAIESIVEYPVADNDDVKKMQDAYDNICKTL